MNSDPKVRYIEIYNGLVRKINARIMNKKDHPVTPWEEKIPTEHHVRFDLNDSSATSGDPVWPEAKAKPGYTRQAEQHLIYDSSSRKTAVYIVEHYKTEFRIVLDRVYGETEEDAQLRASNS